MVIRSDAGINITQIALFICRGGQEKRKRVSSNDFISI